MRAAACGESLRGIDQAGLSIPLSPERAAGFRHHELTVADVESVAGRRQENRLDATIRDEDAAHAQTALATIPETEERIRRPRIEVIVTAKQPSCSAWCWAPSGTSVTEPSTPCGSGSGDEGPRRAYRPTTEPLRGSLRYTC